MPVGRRGSPTPSVTSDTEDEYEYDVERDTVQHPAPAAQWKSNALMTPTTTTHSPVAMLPAEILIHVLKQLGSSKDLHNALLVSRTWCSCSVELLWHKPHFGRLASLFKLIHIVSRKDQTFTYARFIRRLNFAALGRDLSDQLFTRLASCTRLERLTLVGCDVLSDDALHRVLSCTPSLVALDLTGVTETTDMTICALASVAPNLQGINLGACSKVTDEGIAAIAAHCRLLRRIKLSGVNQLTDAAVIALAHNCPLLIEVDLHHCERITDISVRQLWLHSTNLRELRVAHCEELTDLALPAAGPQPAPAINPFTTIAPSNNTTARVLDPLPPLYIPHPFTHLRQLDLTGLAFLTDDAVAGIIANSPRLRNLVLAKCVRLTDASVESICKLGRHLHFLHLGHAACITDRSICTLARTCTRLRYIDLACCTLLTDISVFELSALPKLRRIGLVRVANLTDQAIHHLAERHHTLERIHLSYCENISVPAVHYLLQKLHRLTHLSLTGIPAFRRPELQKFCRQPPKDFTPQQRDAFCVYSGRGVNDLRRYLESIASPLHMGGDDGDDSDGDISGLDEEEFVGVPYGGGGGDQANYLGRTTDNAYLTPTGVESGGTSPGEATTPTHQHIHRQLEANPIAGIDRPSSAPAPWFAANGSTTENTANASDPALSHHQPTTPSFRYPQASSSRVPQQSAPRHQQASSSQLRQGSAAPSPLDEYYRGRTGGANYVQNFTPSSQLRNGSASTSIPGQQTRSSRTARSVITPPPAPGSGEPTGGVITPDLILVENGHGQMVGSSSSGHRGPAGVHYPIINGHPVGGPNYPSSGSNYPNTNGGNYPGAMVRTSDSSASSTSQARARTAHEEHNSNDEDCDDGMDTVVGVGAFSNGSALGEMANGYVNGNGSIGGPTSPTSDRIPTKRKGGGLRSVAVEFASAIFGKRDSTGGSGGAGGVSSGTGGGGGAAASGRR